MVVRGEQASAEGDRLMNIRVISDSDQQTLERRLSDFIANGYTIVNFAQSEDETAIHYTVILQKKVL